MRKSVTVAVLAVLIAAGVAWTLQPGTPDSTSGEPSEVWLRNGREFPLIRLRRSGGTVAGEYAPKGNLRTLYPITDGRKDGEALSFAVVVSGRLMRFRMTRHGDTAKVVCWPDVNALVDEYGAVGKAGPAPARQAGRPQPPRNELLQRYQDAARRTELQKAFRSAGVTDLGIFRRRVEPE